MSDLVTATAKSIDHGLHRNVIHKSDDFVIYQTIANNSVSYEYWIGSHLHARKTTLTDLVTELLDEHKISWHSAIRIKNQEWEDYLAQRFGPRDSVFAFAY